MKNYLKLIVLLIPLTGVVILGFNNCARYGDLEGDAILSSRAYDSSSEGQDSQAFGIPYALLSAEQTLQSMMKATNTTALSNNAMTEYNNRYGALAAGNDLNMANGPMMLGSTSLAGQICSDVVVAESANGAVRNLFTGVNFASGVSGITDATYENVVRGLARQFWGRAESTDELSMLMTYKAAFITDEPVASRTQQVSAQDLMTSTCAAMLSSIESITY